jgi:hypothetical protein
MKRLALAATIAVLLLPGVARAGAATDAALGLGAFAVFNQILSGTGIFGGAPAVAAPAPVVVAPPTPVYVAPPPPVVYRPAPVVYRPAPIYVAPPPPPVVYYPAPPVYRGHPVYYVPRPHHWNGHKRDRW